MEFKTTLYGKHFSKRAAPKNIKDQDRSLFEHEFQKEIRDSHVLMLRGAYILNDVILSPTKLRIYPSYSHVHKISCYKKLRRLKMLVRKGNEVISGVWVIDNWSRGYFHWLTDALPRLLASEEVLKDAPVILPEYYKKLDYVSDSLSRFGKEIIYYDPLRALHVGCLVLPSHTAKSGNYNKWLIGRLRNRITSNKRGEPSRKIYISREKSEKRKISNEKEVQGVMERYGYEIHHFEDYPFEEQVKIIKESQSLIGLHGAGLTNMLFMPADGKVLELRNCHDSHNNCYFALASDLGHSYYYQVSSGDKSDTHRVDIRVDIDELINCLEVMEMDRTRSKKRMPSTL